MKALSIHAPYATAIAGNEKTIEVRSWQTKHRGDLLICSSSKIVDGWDRFLPVGHAIAIVDLTNCRNFIKSDCDAAMISSNQMPENHYAWILDNIRPIKPVKVKGKQRIFNVDIDPEFINIFGDELLNYWFDIGLINHLA